MPPPETTWYKQQGEGLYPPTINLPGTQGQQGQSITNGPPRGRQMGMTSMLRGPQGHSPATGPPGGGHITMPPTATLPAPAAQQGGAQIAVQPAGTGVGRSQAVSGMGTQGPTYQEYLGISMALKHLAPIITDADNSRNLSWQQAVAGDATKLATWKIEATASPGLQFFAYMLVRHSWWLDTQCLPSTP